LSQPPSQPPDPPPSRPSGDFPYGRPSYVPPPYGPPGQAWLPPGPGGQPPPKGHRTAIALGVLAVVAVLAIGGTAFFVVGRNVDSTLAGGLTSTASLASSAAALSTSPSTGLPVHPYQPRSTSTAIPRATVPPEHLGSDPVFDVLAGKCFDGDMQACDDLFANAASNSLYEAYGDTCAGRQPPGTDIYCTSSFPGA
jgi:hypothetical protein